jgi:DNA-directed RNA polymerase subunit H (RpoH/RPB5)
VRKATVEILHQLNIKKIKLTKIILEKIIKKNIKTMWGNTIAIHNILKKKTTK